MGSQPSSTLAGEEDWVRVPGGPLQKSWRILIGEKGSLKSSQLASGGEEHVDGTGPGDVVRTGKMSGVTAGENTLPVTDGVGEGEGVHGDATG